MPPPKGKSTLGKRVRESFYSEQDVETGTWRCVCGTTRKQSGTGYSNLISHAQNKHPEEFQRIRNIDEAYRNGEQSETSRTSRGMNKTSLDLEGKASYFFDPKVISVHGWMDLVVHSLLPFSIIDQPSFHRHVKYSPIDNKTFVKYLGLLTQRVESKIRAALPDLFSIAFDGWTEGGTHYLAIFAVVPANNENGYSTYLLGFSPFENEQSQDSEQHKLYTEYVLGLFGKDFKNVAAMSGDNCSTNRSFSNLVSTPLVGCASHRYNLAVQGIFSESKEVIKKVNELMKKLRTPILAAHLRKHTHLRAKVYNSTRWSSTAEMIRRYQKIKQFIPELDLPAKYQSEMDDYVPTHRENKTIDSLCEICGDLDSVTKMLQKDNMTLAHVRVLFNAVIEKFPCTESRLKHDASIVHNVNFESGLVKIQDKNYEDMTVREKEACKKLSYTDSDGGDSSTPRDGSNMSFAENALKKRKVETEQRQYVDTRFILPTTNLVERLFSKAGYSLNKRRKSLSPDRLEMQIFFARQFQFVEYF